MDFPGIQRIDNYEPLISAEAVARIYQKARSLEHFFSVLGPRCRRQNYAIPQR